MSDAIDDKSDGHLEFVFLVVVDSKPQARVFGPSCKRNWVFWKLSEYVVAFADEGVIEVKRLINGTWEPCDD